MGLCLPIRVVAMEVAMRPKARLSWPRSTMCQDRL